MKKIVMALIAAAGLYAVAPAPASAQATSGMTNSVLDANAQMMESRYARMRRGDRQRMRGDRLRMERRMIMRRNGMRMDRRRMMR